MFVLVASGHLCLHFVENSRRIGGLPGKFMFKDRKIIIGILVENRSSEEYAGHHASALLEAIQVTVIVK